MATTYVPSWTLEKTYAELFKEGRGLTLTRNAIAVACQSTEHYVKTYDMDGTFVNKITTSNLQAGTDKHGHSSPWGIVAHGELYFITDQGPYVKVFDTQGNFQHRFGTLNPQNGKMSFENSESSFLYALHIDSNDHVYIGAHVPGSASENYISIHDLDGTHLSGFSVSGIHPYFMAVTSDNSVIISDWGNAYAVHLYDTSGTRLRVFAPPPECQPGETFCPTGLCVLGNEVFIASFRGVAAVYRYTTAGNFIDVVSKDVNCPWGLAIQEESNKLFVCDEKSIKVFCLLKGVKRFKKL